MDLEFLFFLVPLFLIYSRTPYPILSLDFYPKSFHGKLSLQQSLFTVANEETWTKPKDQNR